MDLQLGTASGGVDFYEGRCDRAEGVESLPIPLCFTLTNEFEHLSGMNVLRSGWNRLEQRKTFSKGRPRGIMLSKPVLTLS